MSDNGDWLENRKYVLSSIERIETKVEEGFEAMRTKLDNLSSDMTTLKTKSGLIGGFLGGLLTLLGSYLFKKFFS